MERSEIGAMPFVRFAPFFAAGTALAYFGGGFAGGVCLTAAAVFGVLCAVKKKFFLIVCAAGLAAGALIMTLYAAFYIEPVLEYSGETVEIKVKVEEIVSRSENDMTFFGSADIGGRNVRLRLTGEARAEEGESFKGKVSLERARGEFEVINLSKGVLLSGRVEKYFKVYEEGFSVSAPFRSLRNTLRERLSQWVFDEPLGLAKGMILGDTDGISDRLYDRLAVSGIRHYTAVSGAHFMILASVLLSIIPNERRRTRAVFSLLLSPCAMIFFGAGVSVFRASIMFLMMGAAVFFRRRESVLNSLCIAVVVILTVNPAAVLDAGFAMSVTGVFGAGVLGPSLAARLKEFIPDKAAFLRPVVSAFSSSVCAVIATAPTAVAVFGGVSFFAPITSLLAAPLLTAAMWLAVMLGITNAGFFGFLLEKTMRAMIGLAEFFGSNRRGFFAPDFEGAWITALAVLVLTVFCAFGGFKTLKMCGSFSAGICAATVIISSILKNDRCEIYFTGNSYTSAAVVITRGTAAVFVSGSGVGLADDISGIMLRHGADRICAAAAFEADFSGRLMLKRLGEIVPIDEIIYDGERFFVGQTEISSSKASAESSGDVVLHHGNIYKAPQSSAVFPIYFTNSDKPLPQNAVNIYDDRSFHLKLEEKDPDLIVVKSKK